MQDPEGRYVTGVVFHDRNRNERRDAGEGGLARVAVSNGEDVVLTDHRGRYALPAREDMIVFVIKPSGWMTPVGDNRLPRFHYIHKPQGSPELKYGGVEPTGPLPSSVDFPLYRQNDPGHFRVVLFGDPQPYTRQEVYYLAHDVVEELVGVEAAFGVSLGDLVGDDLTLFDPLNDVIAHVGIPWYNVLGNHDVNLDAPGDELSDESFERVYGPTCYAFNYGRVHFIVIDDVVADGVDAENEPVYHGGIGPGQLTFIRNDLALVPADRLIVLMMHIPLGSVEDRDALFELLADRRHTLSLSAHHHVQHHHFFDASEGWQGHGTHHHLTNVTTSGSWWSGWMDEEGIPHTTMRDGAPNGYSIITFDGVDYSVRYKAARRPANYQMAIYAPDEITTDQAAATEVLVNVFAGSPKSIVEFRVGEHGDWTPMAHVKRIDPRFVETQEREIRSDWAGKKLPRPVMSRHLWAATLPADPLPGIHAIHVRTTDMFGQQFTDRRLICVLDDTDDESARSPAGRR